MKPVPVNALQCKQNQAFAAAMPRTNTLGQILHPKAIRATKSVPMAKTGQET